MKNPSLPWWQTGLMIVGGLSLAGTALAIIGTAVGVGVLASKSNVTPTGTAGLPRPSGPQINAQLG